MGGSAASSVFNTANKNQVVVVGGSGPTASNATITTPSISNSSFSVLAANPNRKGIVLYNNSNATIVMVAFAATASSSTFTFSLTAKSTYFMSSPIYLGAISAIGSVISGTLMITELT